ncbi:MAG: hypothetical protein AAFQ37_07725, partial [Bacteroidota bacterium]
MIRLIVTDGGCVDSLEQSITILEGLAISDVVCGPSDLNEVTIEWGSVPSATGYEVLLPDGQLISTTQLEFTLGNLTPDSTVTLLVRATSLGPCSSGPFDTITCTTLPCPMLDADFSSITTSICLETNAPLVPLSAVVNGGSGIDATFSWSGPGVSGTNFDPNIAGIGSHWVFMDYSEEGPCSLRDSVQISVFAIPTGDFSLSTIDLCIGDTLVVNYTGTANPDADFDWSFGSAMVLSGTGSGPYELTWSAPGTYPIRLTVTEDGCSSVIPTQADSVFVSAPLGAVELQCLPATFDSVVFLWDPLPGVALYAVEVLGGASIIQTETSFTVAGLQPGEAVTLIVTPQSISACGPGTADTLTCFVATCPDLSADFSALPTSVCLEPSVMPIPLEATIIGSGNIDSVFNWSGTGVVGRNFNPIVAGVGEHWIFLDYAEEGPCTLRDSFLISVFSLPTGNFTLSTSDICLGDTIEVNYSGTASPDADFDWEFGAANILSGAGGGPYTLTWDAPGTYPIRLIVTENGCSSISPTEADSVTVNAPLPPVDLQCGPISFDSVTIVWNPVAGAINYSVVIIGGAFSIQADTSITLTGLMPGEIVQMVVRPIGTGACGTGPADTISCMVRACPDLSIDFSAIDSTVCFESTTGPVNLVAIVNGASGAMASENWSGPGVVGNIFDPQLVGPGIYTLIFDYQEEGPCKITDSIRMIVSVPPPSNFSITPEDICITESTTIEYIGTASDAAIFNWDFGVGSIESGSGRGPYSVSWDEPGIYPVSLTVSEAGCVDASA